MWVPDRAACFADVHALLGSASDRGWIVDAAVSFLALLFCSMELSDQECVFDDHGADVGEGDEVGVRAVDDHCMAAEEENDNSGLEVPFIPHSWDGGRDGATPGDDRAGDCDPPGLCPQYAAYHGSDSRQDPG